MVEVVASDGAEVKIETVPAEGEETVDSKEDLYEELRDKRASADYKAATPVMRQTMNNVLPLDFTAKMPSITAEVLLIWGEHDTATPLEHGQIMESLIPNSGLAVIHGAGHFSYADNYCKHKAT